MIRVKNILSLSLLIFVSCEFHTAMDPLYPIPVLKVKMGEEKAFDLSNYFRNENVNLLFNESLQHISLLGNDLIIDASSVTSGFENISLIADGRPIHIFIEYEFMARHTFSFESEKANSVVVMGGFNDWSRSALPLLKRGNQFSRTVFMSPKKHEYKFVVDGIEEIDPENPVFDNYQINQEKLTSDLQS